MHGLHIPPQPITDLPRDWSRRGVGLSDAPPLSPALASRFFYTNTFYHQYPHLDITNPPPELDGELDFIVCSDVLEHIPYLLIEPALAGLLRCLRPRGVAVITVPVAGERTYEYYPGLTEFELVEQESRPPVVNWTDTAGVRHTDTSPDMHDGGGLTLTFRLWGPKDVEARLLSAGFEPVWQPWPAPDLGIPMIADPGIFIAYKPGAAEPRATAAGA
jgi:SAM-dependent methyltransferase